MKVHSSYVNIVYIQSLFQPLTEQLISFLLPTIYESKRYVPALFLDFKALTASQTLI